MVDSNTAPQHEQIKECRLCGTQYAITHVSDVCDIDSGELAIVSSDKMIGSVIGGRYTLSSLIGLGGWSSVYRAEDSQLKRSVAVKILHQFLQSDENRIKRFQREAVIAASLSHPNITTMFDFGVLANGQPYIVMEYLQGKSLEKIVEEQGQLNLERALGIANQLCQAVELAHKGGLVHRDLKPGNIFILDSDFVKILDFGLAKSAQEIESYSTSGQTLGTPLFMSPEQCRSADVDHRSDIYSLGAVIHFMLTGKPPFQATTIFEAMQKHIADAPPRLSESRPDLNFPPALEQAVLRALNKDPAERYDSCLKLNDAVNGQVSAEYTKSAKQLLNKLSIAVAIVAVVAGLSAAIIVASQSEKVPPSALHKDNLGVGKKITSRKSANAAAQDSVSLSGLRSNDEAIAKLSEISDCHQLRIARSTIGDPVLKYALDNYRSLRLVAFVDTEIDDQGLALLSSGQLASLNVARTRVTDKGLAELKSTGLINLILNSDNVTDVGIKSLEGLSLDNLILHRTKITNGCAESLSKFPTLKGLSLADTYIGDDTVARLAALPHLKSLNLKGTDVSDGCAKYLAQMPELEELSVGYTKLTNAGLTRLAECKRLQRLDINRTDTTTSGARVLLKSGSLKAVFVGDSSSELRSAFKDSKIAIMSDEEEIFQIDPFMHAR